MPNKYTPRARTRGAKQPAGTKLAKRVLRARGFTNSEVKVRLGKVKPAPDTVSLID